MYDTECVRVCVCVCVCVCVWWRSKKVTKERGVDDQKKKKSPSSAEKLPDDCFVTALCVCVCVHARARVCVCVWCKRMPNPAELSRCLVGEVAFQL